MADRGEVAPSRSDGTVRQSRSWSVQSNAPSTPACSSREYNALAQGFTTEAELAAAKVEELHAQIQKLLESKQINEEQAKLNKQHAKDQQFEEDLAVRKAETLKSLSPHVLKAVARRVAAVEEDVGYIGDVASGRENDHCKLWYILVQEMLVLAPQDMINLAQTITDLMHQSISDDDLAIVASAYGCLKRAVESDVVSRIFQQVVTGGEDSHTYARSGDSIVQHTSATEDGGAVEDNRNLHQSSEGQECSRPRRMPRTFQFESPEVAKTRLSMKQLEENSEEVAVEEYDKGASVVLTSSDPIPSDLTEYDEEHTRVIEDTFSVQSAVTQDQIIEAIDDLESSKSLQRDNTTEPTEEHSSVVASKPTRGQSSKLGTPLKRTRDENSVVSTRSQDSVMRKAKQPRTDGELTKRMQAFVKRTEKLICKENFDLAMLNCVKCDGDAVDPRVTNCNHIYCQKCIREIQNSMSKSEATKALCIVSACGKKVGDLGIVPPEVIEQLRRKYTHGVSDDADAEEEHSVKSEPEKA